MLVDLDRFQLINETCGHFAGDQALRNAAEVLRSGLPAEAELARLGADEFAALLPDTSPAEALALAGRLLAALRQQFGGHGVKRADQKPSKPPEGSGEAR